MAIRKSTKVLIGIVSIALLTSAIILGLRSTRRISDKSNESPVVLRLGYRPNALADVSPVILKEANLGVTQGLRVELVPVANPQIALQKFDAGEVDALAGIPMEAILQRMAEKGDPGFKAYYFQVDQQGEGWVSLVVNKTAKVQSIGDLAGKTVASLPTNQAQYLLRRILKSAGLPEDGIHIVTYNPATPLSGFASGEHAAIFGLEPAISRAVVQGHRVLVAGPVSQYLYNGRPVPVSASVIRKDFLSHHPGSLDQFITVVDKAVEIQRSDPNRVRGYFAKQEYGGIEPEARERLFLPVMRKPEPSLMTTLDEFTSDLFSNGILKAKVSSNALVD